MSRKPLLVILRQLQSFIATQWHRFVRQAAPPALNGAPLSGAPPHIRVKTYSAETGYVYQYVYRGHRRAPEGLQYHFECTRDRKSWNITIVLLSDRVLQSWQETHQRTLSPNEQYAIAKLTLFALFDRAGPDSLPGPTAATTDDIDAFLERLDLL